MCRGRVISGGTSSMRWRSLSRFLLVLGVLCGTLPSVLGRDGAPERPPAAQAESATCRMADLETPHVVVHNACPFFLHAALQRRHRCPYLPGVADDAVSSRSVVASSLTPAATLGSGLARGARCCPNLKPNGLICQAEFSNCSKASNGLIGTTSGCLHWSDLLVP